MTDPTSPLAGTELIGSSRVPLRPEEVLTKPLLRRRRKRRGRHLARPGRRSEAWFVAVVVAIVALGAAGTSLALTSRTHYAPAPSVTPGSHSALPAATPPGAPCPLSGVPAPDGRVPQRPALAVKVDNYPAARPQSGLDKADVVFEEPVEGGITRLVAVFQCQSTGLVGPIRSARAVDAQILDELSDPVFVHVGGISPVLALVSRANDHNENVPNTGSTVQNPPGRYPPYDTYISTSAGWDLEPADTSPPNPIFSFSGAAPKGTPVTSLEVPFSGTNDNTWTWEPSSGTWMLAIGGDPATVADGSRIAVANVVVESVQVSYGPWSENSLGALEVQSKLTGSGPLEVFRNGVETSGTWRRASLGDPTSLVDTEGNTIALQPGETWVELVPSSIKVSVSSSP